MFFTIFLFEFRFRINFNFFFPKTENVDILSGLEKARAIAKAKKY